jgi:electron transfer flavoprotein beta subunit
MALKIGVFIKHVFDTNARIQLKGDLVDEADVKYVINPYDEFAVEEAIRTKDAWVKGGEQVEIVGLTVGPTAAQKSLRDAFAVGVDRGIHVVDNEKRAVDSRGLAKALAGVCKDENFHLIFAGKQAVDTDSHSIPQMVAELLKIPHVAVVSKCEWTGTGEVKVERDIEGGMKEIYSLKLPALIAANKGLNKMRLASLPGIRAAAKNEIKEVPLPADIKSSIKISGWSLPAERGKVKMIEGEPAQQAAELVKRLHEEAKIV